MTNKVRKLIWLSPEEDAEINGQIAADPDDFETDVDWFKEAKPSAEIIPHILERYHREQDELKAGKRKD